MTDVTKNVANSPEPETEFLPPARFDESANANAQPVEPIPASRVADWIQRARNARQFVPRRTKALAMVIVAGLALGTLGGTMLVKETSSLPNGAPVAQESNTETTPTQGAIEDPVPSKETVALDAAALALERANQTSSRSRRGRNSPPVRRASRAYRVAVIR